MIRIFGFSVSVTVVILLAAAVLGGWEVFVIVAILAILEISLSFDNAVVNATVLKRMSVLWQQIFLTVGILIAVFGMRLLFPLLLVAVTAGLGPREVIDLALNNPDAYASALEAAKPAIASFGGVFLGMIFLDFILEDRDIKWLKWIERPLAKAGLVEALSIAVGLLGVVLTARYLAGENDRTVLFAGTIGLITYLFVNGLASFFEGEEDDDEADGTSGSGATGQAVLATGKAGLFLFLYLEVLDASFSFDGVIGAFAVSTNIFVIAAGLGIGAMYIRSLTIFLVRKGTLDEYVYLEHGAHYAIGALAVLLLTSIRFDIPEIVTGLIGVGFIGLAFVSSLNHNRKQKSEANEVPGGQSS
jgi:hypothetical protein